jgi:SAM-dependent methyltransferase
VGTDYDAIADDYKRAKQQPWRFYIERYTLLRLIGDLRGRAVLDLACGEGYYTRVLRHRGAARVLGVDLSEGMIRLAREEEARRPLGIEYRVQDARAVDEAWVFDIVVAAYLLNYAATREELDAMCAAIGRALKPGGRFVGVNNNPEHALEHFGSSKKYGFVKITPGALAEGAPITYTIFLDDGSINITNYWLSTEAHEAAFRAAGFSLIRWHRPRVSAEGQAAFGNAFWESFLRHPPVTFLECVR